MFETVQLLEKHYQELKDFDLTILVDDQAFIQAFDKTLPIIKNFTGEQRDVLNTEFDISVNLSLNEESWRLHGEIQSKKKLGVYLDGTNTVVQDLWSSYLLTLKAKTPFLTFHLQDIFRNILGFRSFTRSTAKKSSLRQIAIGQVSPAIFSPENQEELIYELSLSYPGTPLRDITEIDLVSDLAGTLYIGPATLDAIKLCEAGGRGIFLSSTFQGFNLMPYGNENVYLSSRGKKFITKNLLPFVDSFIRGKIEPNNDYALYLNDNENVFGAYLKCLNQCDDNYPFYQSHVVLWNYLLNLFDTNLDVTKCTEPQLQLMKSQHDVLTKLIRLHDYAMSSLDTIYHESKSPNARAEVIQGHIQNLEEMDKISDQIAGSHVYLRPFLDFYRIRKGQIGGANLVEQAQSSYLTYAEEHQALRALHELFSVTLKENNVRI